MAPPLPLRILFLLAFAAAASAAARREAFRRDPGHAQWHHGAFHDVEDSIRADVRRMLHTRAEVPFQVPLEVNVVLIGFNGDGGYRYPLDGHKLEEFLKMSFPLHRPSCFETGEPIDIEHHIVYNVIAAGQPELISLEKSLKAAMVSAGTARESEYGREFPLFEVEATAVEHIFERLYSFIFDIEPGHSATEMDRPVPVAIFVVNFDKVRMDPRNKGVDLDGLMYSTIGGLTEQELKKQEADYIYRYRYNGGGATQVWLSSGRFVVIDLSAGPCTYGKIETEEGSVSYRSMPRLSNIIFPRGLAAPSASSTQNIFMGQLGGLISTTIEHVIAPDIRFETVDMTLRLLVPIIVLQNHNRYNILQAGHNNSIDVQAIEREERAAAGWNRTLTRAAAAAWIRATAGRNPGAAGRNRASFARNRSASARIRSASTWIRPSPTSRVTSAAGLPLFVSDPTRTQGSQSSVGGSASNSIDVDGPEAQARALNAKYPMGSCFKTISRWNWPCRKWDLKKMRKAKRGGDHLTRGFRKSRSASKNESLVSVMRKAKRGGDHLTGGFRKSRSASKNESLVSGCFRGDSDQGVWSGLSDTSISHLSKSVASIALYNGDTILFSCSGIAMERQGCNLTRFLTSASLVRAVNGTNKDHDDLKIEVRPEGNEVYMGVLDEFDLDCNFVVVNVHAFLDVQVGSFQHALQILPHGDPLVLVGRGVSGEIIAKNIEFDRYLTVSEDDEDVDCKTSEAWDGGPLVSIDGEFVGMILFLTARRAVFLPWGTILKHLEHYWASQQKKTGLARSKTSKLYRVGAKPIGEKSNSHPEVHRNFLTQEQLDLYYMGYPKLPSSMLGAGMILVNSFEETFGDIHGEGVWRNFGKRASNIDRNVVALASFNGEKRFFACTGFFIEWNGSTIILTSASLARDSGDENEVLQNLTIEVLFRNQRSKGTLEHCNLHYNVAVISVKNQPSVRPPNTLLRLCNILEVAAIGRCFESGALMATSGDLVSWTGTLDCDFLSTSTCKITKAGIGGPLVTLDGDVIGMNFYDKKIGTPFLGMAEIYEILTSFETKSKLGEVGNDSDPSAYSWKMDEDDKTKLNRWPVPVPCWCNPDHADEDKSDDESVSDCKSRFALRYGYIKGEKVILY